MKTSPEWLSGYHMTPWNGQPPTNQCMCEVPIWHRCMGEPGYNGRRTAHLSLAQADDPQTHAANKQRLSLCVWGWFVVYQQITGMDDGSTMDEEAWMAELSLSDFLKAYLCLTSQPMEFSSTKAFTTHGQGRGYAKKPAYLWVLWVCAWTHPGKGEKPWVHDLCPGGMQINALENKTKEKKNRKKKKEMN